MKESWNSIKCPFCFRKFAHNEVHFRIAEEASIEAGVKFNKASSDDEKKKYEKFMKRTKIDPKYDVVWGNLRGGTPTKSVQDLFYLPWVDENNKNEMIVGDYITDEEGFVEKIEDRCGHFESKTRICPYCHNKLPLHYGKNPQKFIAILGVSSSGKTVFIKQLLSKIQASLEDGILSHVAGNLSELTLPEDDNSYLTLDQPLPDSTKDLNFKVPYFATMCFKKDNILTYYNFVIYDVAGETLVNADPNKFGFFAGYIKESDGIITLIDPAQLVNNPRPEYPAGQMITTLFQVFGGKVKIPNAITISKSDLLLSDQRIKESLNENDKFFGENSIITKNIPWDSTKKYFYADEHARLNGQLKKMLSEKANPFYESVINQNEDASFFAISALFDGVDERLIFELSSKNEWKSDHIQEYIEKFAILKKKLQDIQYDLEDQEANPDENIIDTANIIVNRAFVFEQSDDVVRKLDSILGRVSMLSNRREIRDAVEQQFSQDEKINLPAYDRCGDESITTKDLIRYIEYLNKEMDDCIFDIYIQGYPRSNGDLKSLRIEEPFFWLLSELDIINHGNLFTQEPPKSNNFKIKLSGFWRK